METIKEFDFATLSDADKVVLYSRLHPLYAKSTLEVDVGLQQVPRCGLIVLGLVKDISVWKTKLLGQFSQQMSKTHTSCMI